MRTITFTHVNNDTNGNPRYVCHFLDLLKEGEFDIGLGGRYNAALARARTIGGRKFHNRQYGGGIVFMTYSLDETCKYISELVDEPCEWRL